MSNTKVLEEFDEKFGYIAHALDYYTNETYMVSRKSGEEHLNQIKSFIDQKLTEQREEIIEAIENLHFYEDESPNYVKDYIIEITIKNI
jgi:hydroxymethylpyrimidine pyrophosphatase-like HAD family hydrolase